MTNHTSNLIGAAMPCVDVAWRGDRDCLYVKAGALLDELCPPEAASPSLFAAASTRGAKLMEAMDQLNGRFVRNEVFPAAMGVERAWKLKAEHRSLRYTTRLEDLPCVR